MPPVSQPRARAYALPRTPAHHAADGAAWPIAASVYSKRSSASDMVAVASSPAISAVHPGGPEGFWLERRR